MAVLASDDRLVCSFTNFVRFEDGTEKFMPDQFTYYPDDVAPFCGQLSIGGEPSSSLSGRYGLKKGMAW